MGFEGGFVFYGAEVNGGRRFRYRRFSLGSLKEYGLSGLRFIFFKDCVIGFEINLEIFGGVRVFLEGKF